MKRLLLITLFALILFSCQKEIKNDSSDSGYLDKVELSLKDSISATDYASLDFSKVAKTFIDSGNVTLLRIPFKQKSINSDFILLQTTVEGGIKKGRVIHINGAVSTGHQYNGSILITSLKGNTLIESGVTNGYVEAFLPADVSSRLLEPFPVQAYYPWVSLPEVIVVGSYSTGTISWSTLFSLMSFFNDPDTGGGAYGYYSWTDPFRSPGGGGGGNTIPLPPAGPVVIEDPVWIDFENQYDNPAIDLEKFMKCFSNIPDAGATGSIEIFTDIPVNGDPGQFFDWENGSPGHAFIQLRKSNGSQSVCQNIGFYPVTGWKNAMSPTPHDAKWVDNQQHEFNASYKISLNPSQIQAAVTKILNLSHSARYDIDDYNCTDWALDIFNDVATIPQLLEIPRYHIPGGQAPLSNTPQGLYVKLQEMKATGTPGVTVPVIGWVGHSDGPCN
jgi:hypothetical protein